MMELIQAIILSIIQGITEWLPISSSGHLAILHEIFGFQSLSFDVYLHLSSILAILLIFFSDIIVIFKKKDFRFSFLLLFATIPAGLVGLLLKDYIESVFANIMFLGIFFILSGIFIYSTKFAKNKNKRILFKDSILIGIAQTIAILPGVSRSGATISSGLFMGIDKKELVRFSFILAIPVILGASLLEAKDIISSSIGFDILFISFFTCLLTSIFTIKVLLRIIRSDKFYLFGIYNLILGIIVLLYWILIR